MAVSISGNPGAGGFRSSSTGGGSSSPAPASAPASSTAQVIVSGQAQSEFQKSQGQSQTASDIAASRPATSFLGGGGVIVGSQVGRNNELVTASFHQGDVPNDSTVSQLMSPQNIRETVVMDQFGVPHARYDVMLGDRVIGRSYAVNNQGETADEQMEMLK